MGHDTMITRPDAVERMLSLHRGLVDGPTDAVSLSEITGRMLADEIVATADSPPNSHATMDGFAFDATDEYPLELAGEVYPEDDPPEIAAGQAVAIATGAPLPARANAVLKREEATVNDGQLSGTSIAPGTYVYERGSNITAGESLFSPGERLGPQDAILLRDLGYETVTVRSRLSVGLLATGTEIHEGRSADLDTPMLSGLVQAWGHHPTEAGTVPDAYEQVRDRIAELAAEHDVVITTGGTSVGHKDYVVRALADLGSVHFHGVRIRPGKPIAVATLEDHNATAIAIPGKPVGAYTIAVAVVRPFFTGREEIGTVEAVLQRDIGIPREGFEYWIPVDLSRGANGTQAMPLGHIDSPLGVYDDTFDPSVLSSSTRASRAAGMLITEEAVAAGDVVQVAPHDSFV